MRCQAACVRRAKVAVGTGKGLHLGFVLLHVRREMTPPRRGELAVLALKRILIRSVHQTVGNGLASLVSAEVAVLTLVPFRIRHDDSWPWHAATAEGVDLSPRANRKRTAVCCSGGDCATEGYIQVRDSNVRAHSGCKGR